MEALLRRFVILKLQQKELEDQLDLHKAQTRKIAEEVKEALLSVGLTRVTLTGGETVYLQLDYYPQVGPHPEFTLGTEEFNKSGLDAGKIRSWVMEKVKTGEWRIRADGSIEGPDAPSVDELRMTPTTSVRVRT